MTSIHAEDFHLSEYAFRALRNLRDKPTERVGYQASIEQLMRKRFVKETNSSPGYQLTTLGEMFLGLGPAGRKQLADVSSPALRMLLRIVAHRGTLPVAQTDNRMVRAIGADSSRRWARQRMGEESMVVEATAQGLAIAQLVSYSLTHSCAPEDEKILLPVRPCPPETALFPALARGAPLDAEDLPELYHLRDLGHAELVAPSMAPPPRRERRRFHGSPVWRFTAFGSRKARLLRFEVPEPAPASPDPVQPLPVGSGQTLRALVQGEHLVRHDEHRLRDLEALRLVERLVPDHLENPCLWRATTAGVVLATVELHAQANAAAVKNGIPEQGDPEQGDPEQGDPEQGASESGAAKPGDTTFGPSNLRSSTP